MTSDERREAELRADAILECQDFRDFTVREALIKAYLAGRESRDEDLILYSMGAAHERSEKNIHIAESKTFVDESIAKIKQLSADLKTERARAVELVDQLKYLREQVANLGRMITDVIGVYHSSEGSHGNGRPSQETNPKTST